MPSVVVSCRAKDIRRVRIHCRCGEVSVAEFPQQVAAAKNGHFCPGCNAMFTIQQRADKTFKITREDVELGDMTFVSPQQPGEKAN